MILSAIIVLDRIFLTVYIFTSFINETKSYIVFLNGITRLTELSSGEVDWRTATFTSERHDRRLTSAGHNHTNTESQNILNDTYH